MWEILKEHKTMLPGSPKETKKTEPVLKEKQIKAKTARKKKEPSVEIQKLHEHYKHEIQELENTIEYYRNENHRFNGLLHLLLQKFGTVIDKKECREDESDFYPPVSVKVSKKEFEANECNHEPVFFVNKLNDGYTISFADELHIITISGCGSDAVTKMYESSIDKRPNVQDDWLVDEIMEKINARSKNQK
jgi:hypothetical protein